MASTLFGAARLNVYPSTLQTLTKKLSPFILIAQKPTTTSPFHLTRRASTAVRDVGSDPGGVGPDNGAGEKEEYDFDLFTIGAGSGGVRASRFAANYGAKVAVCELPFATISSDYAGGVGGTCVLRGCVPKKLLVYSSKYSHEFEESCGFGWNYETEPKHDWSTLMANKNAELQRLTGIYINILKNVGVTLIEGRGKMGNSTLQDIYLYQSVGDHLSQTFQERSMLLTQILHWICLQDQIKLQ